MIWLVECRCVARDGGVDVGGVGGSGTWVSASGIENGCEDVISALEKCLRAQSVEKMAILFL